MLKQQTDNTINEEGDMKNQILSFAVTVVMAALFWGCFNNPVDSEDRKPAFTKKQKDVSVDYGETVTLKVSADGEPSPVFSWKKDGETINGETDSQLTIKGVGLADAGRYIVRARNSEGSVYDTIIVKVSGGEPVIGGNDEIDPVRPGDKVVLTVSVAGDHPFEYQWFRGDEAIDGEEDSVLTIKSVKKEDLADYTVVVTNAGGSDTSDVMSVELLPATIFVIETDYQTGLMERIDAGNNEVTGNAIAIHCDAVINAYNRYVYILERMGADNVIKYDPEKDGNGAVMYQVHLGDNWNPQDIEFDSDTKAYIANMNEPKITVFNPEEGSVIKNIDIAEYTVNPDSNTSPYANAMALADGKLYVLLQRRDGFNPAETSLILTIDTETDKVLKDDTISCSFKNGYDIIAVEGALYVTNPGSASETDDGGIEKVDLASGEVSTVITEEELGGSPNQILHKENSRFYVQNYIGWMDVSVVEIDADEGEVVEVLDDITDAFGGIAYDKDAGRLYVGERDVAGSGVKIFENNELSGEKAVKSSNSLPPSGITFIR
jgi:hypothetical protein